MTATTTERNTPAQSPTDLKPADYPVLAATKILKGTLFVIDADGYAKPGATATGLFCAGRAKCTVDNTDGASGDLRVEAEEGVFRWVNGDSITLAHVGDPAFVADNQTVYKTGTGKSFAGVIRKVDSIGVWVETSMALSSVYAIGAGDYTTLTTNLASTANGDGASMIGVEDAAGNFAGTNVETVLAEIISDYAATTNGNGASKIGVEDAAGHTANTTVETILAEILMHLRSTQTEVPLPLFEWREVDGNGDVADAAGNGGILASDTTPILRASAAESHEISWAAGNTDIISFQRPLPASFDGTQDVTLDLWVYTDNGGGGGIDAATFTVETSWDGGALVTDTATDGTPATSHHKITATIANGDIPNTARYVTIHLTPAAHAADPVQLVNACLNIKPKLLTS